MLCDTDSVYTGGLEQLVLQCLSSYQARVAFFDRS